MRKYWEQGLSAQSLSSLQTGQVRRLYSMCYHCRGRGHIKANYPDRKKRNRMPWERAWGAKSRSGIKNQERNRQETERESKGA